VPVAAPAGASLAFWYIAASNTLIVVVIDLFVSWLLGFVDGVIVGDLRHWFSLLLKI
jgi:hypothetical protein